jgi:hypothetical protein
LRVDSKINSETAVAEQPNAVTVRTASECRSGGGH